MRNIYIPGALITYLVVTGLLRSTALSKAVKSGGALTFGPTDVVRWILILLILGFASAAVYVSIVPPRYPAGALIFGVIAVVGTLAFPSQILVTATSVMDVNPWGKTKTILWSEVVGVEYHKGPATTVVIGKSGTRIAHTGWNRDSQGFLEICNERTGLSAITNAL